MRAVVLVTGDEVLEGRVGDRNGRYLSGQLFETGADLVRVEFVGDELGAITSGVRRAIADGANLVLTTGGLGPTHDDITMQAVADAVGLDMVVLPDVAEVVRRRCARHSRWHEIAPEVQEQNVAAQAALPSGSTPIPPTGTAPGAVVPHARGLVVVLPGPPSECVPMWHWATERAPLVDLLARGAGGHTTVVRIAGLVEAQLVEFLGTVSPNLFEGVRMGICARAGEVEITLRDPSGAERVERLAGVLADRYRDTLISSDGRDTDAIVADALRATGRTVAVAESCTGGLLGARLTARPGSSAYVMGGVIAYDNRVKQRLLGVAKEILLDHGAVSDACARAMAQGVRAATGADFGVSITGIAGPGGGTDEKPVGTVFVGVAGPDGVDVVGLHLAGERDAVRERAVGHAMQALRLAVTRAAPGAQTS